MGLDVIEVGKRDFAGGEVPRTLPPTQLRITRL